MTMPLKVAIYRGSEFVGEESFDRDIIKIGRLASAHLKLDDTRVSRIHAVIEAASDGDGFQIIDMGSSDGTFVNGERISKERLKDGDEIQLGDSRLVVSLKRATMDIVDNQVMAADLAVPSHPPVAAEAPAPMAWSADMTPDYGQYAPTQAGMAAAMPGMMQASGMAVGGVPMQMPMNPDMMAAQAWASSPEAWQQQAAFMSGQTGYAYPPGYAPTDAAYAQMPFDPSQVPQAAYPDAEAWAQAQAGYGMAAASPYGAWGSVPNNLASESVSESERSLEIKVIWGDTVLDTITVHDQPTVTMGDEAKSQGFGPFKKFKGCDIDAPTRGLATREFPLAVSQSQTGATYKINIASSFTGYLERADGFRQTVQELLAAGRNIDSGDVPEARGYNLQPAETLYLTHGLLTLQVRYVRRQKFIPPPWTESLNYTWVNVLILTFFLHVLAVSVFVATPRTTEELIEALFKNPNRFANYMLTPEKKQENTLLAKLKAGEQAAKAKGNEGKAGKKDHNKKEEGRMAVRGKPDDAEIAKSSLQKLLGAGAKGGASYLFGTGGLGGELKSALGGVTGAEIGDASGLGGLGTRGTGPGGGGLSMNSVGLGSLGTAGRGGGGDGYGSGVGKLGNKVERDINITAGTPVIMGSLDKELIRRVIEQHKAQIRYCYEKELVRNPGLFGKLGMVWTIQADGSVRDVSVKQTTMNDPNVERCIASKIRTWMFPKPKGGGIVIVNYPFVFKSSG